MKEFGDFLGCSNCYSQWFEIADEYMTDISGARVKQVWKILSESGVQPSLWMNELKDRKCPNCDNEIKLGTYMLEDADLFCEEVANIIIDYINDDIEGCRLCDGGKIEYTEKYGDHLELSKVHDLMESYGIYDDLGDLYYYIASRISCSCGNELDPTEPYVTKKEIDEWYCRPEKQAAAETIIKTFNINKYKARDFIDFLFQYPMLALEDNTGRQIFEKIKNLEIPGVITLPTCTILYRARSRDPLVRQVPFVPRELWAPPLGLPGHGRFNPVGVQVLYLSDSAESTIREIRLDKDTEVAEIARFVLLKDLKLWDVRNLDINDFLLMPSMNKYTISKEYLFPNFLAQCCATSELNGILYGSVQNEGGWNIALLKYTENVTIALDKVRCDVSTDETLKFRYF